MKLIPSFVLTAALSLAGCANTTSIQLVASGKSEFDGAVYSGEVVNIEAQVTGIEKYRVFQQGATGFVSIQNIRTDVEEIASGFCRRKGKAMHAVTETASKPPHILGNFPRVELIFQCTEHKISKVTIGENGKYEKLALLKNLLDSGTLSQKEFEAEKTKILATP